MTEQVLVTGASGFIGYHLVRALVDSGYEVTCLVRATSNVSAIAPYGVAFVEGDVTRKDTLVDPIGKVSSVFHLAGSTTSFSAEMHTRVNEGGTRNIAEACAESERSPKLIIVSSSAAVGPSPPNRPMKETDSPTPVSIYGHSKLAGETVARRSAGEVPITIIRPAIVFGEHDRDVFRMFDLVAHGWHLVPGMKTRYFSLIHAADLSQAMILAAKKGENLPAPGEDPELPGQGIYFIADDWAPSYAELGSMMADALSSKAKVVKIPGPFVWGLAIVNEILARIRREPSILNMDKAREAFSGSWVYSPEKAKRQLGFMPDATVRERIRQTGKWYQEQGWL